MSYLINSLKTKGRSSASEAVGRRLHLRALPTLVEPPVDSVHPAISPRVRRGTACLAGSTFCSIVCRMLNSLTPNRLAACCKATVRFSALLPSLGNSHYSPVRARMSQFSKIGQGLWTEIPISRR
jgi:hypothetical protein